MKSGSLVRMVVAVSLLLPAAMSAAPNEASACGALVRKAVDPKSLTVARAEQSLGDGKHAQAAAGVAVAFPAIKAAKPGESPLSDRALRILALATVRANGVIAVRGMQGNTPAGRAANLQWSVDTIRKLSARRANNATFQTDLGEALSKLPKHHAEALKILGDLATKDLLTSAEGYAALAKLRAASGDAPGREAAVKRCEGMAKAPNICQAGADSNSRS